MIFEKMSFKEYKELDAINYSTLKYMAESPLAYIHNKDNPRPETPALYIGRAVHKRVLEPDGFNSEFAIFEGERRAGPDWKAFLSSHANKTILKMAEMDEVVDMTFAVTKSKWYAEFFKDGRPEVAFTWMDKETGLTCKGRADMLLGKALVGLKTARSVIPREFQSDGARMLYHLQWGMYEEGLLANGVEIEKVVEVAVRKKAPHDVAVFSIGEHTLTVGRNIFHSLLQRVSECRMTDAWPGVAPEPVDFHLPAWADSSDMTTITMDGEEVEL